MCGDGPYLMSFVWGCVLIMEELVAPLEMLPPVEFAMAYGSGVFRQPGHSALSKGEVSMVDYIFGVTSPEAWHSQNIAMNPHHYSSWISCFGGKGVSFIANQVGVGIHFNAFVPWRGKMMKYGVTSIEKLAEDILTWRWLYISGRLQKPVRILVDNWDLAKVNQVNLMAAVSVALLLLPNQFTEEDLYAKITSLSYIGDVRMLFAEDKEKVRRIVHGNFRKFTALYTVPLYHMAALGLLELPSSIGHKNSVFIKDSSPSATESLLTALPSAVLQRFASQKVLQVESKNADIFPGERLCIEGNPSKPLQKVLTKIVWTSSIKQMVSGFVATGGTNSIHYVLRKMVKAWRSRF